LLDRLPDGFDLSRLVVPYGGESVPVRVDTFGRIPGSVSRAVDRAAHSIEVADPDVLFVMADVWFCGQLLRRLREYKPHMKRVAWIPVDGALTEPRALEHLAACDVLATYSAFGRAQLSAGFEALGIAAPRVRVVPLGIDRTSFYPLCGDLRRRVRAALFGDERSFVVLNASEPHPRACLDVSIEGFAAFAAGKPHNVKLHLHAATWHAGSAIRALVARHHLEDRALYSPFGPDRSGEGERQLNRLYNACDVGLSTSSGESFGIVALEHAAANRPQIVPRHTAYEETWAGDGALALKPRPHAPSPADVAAALDALYLDQSRRRQLASAAYARASDPRFGWDAVARGWALTFRGLVAEKVCELTY